MLIDRIVVAKSLNTIPSNIKYFKIIENKIEVQLRNSKYRVIISIEEYQKCLQKTRQGKSHSDNLNYGSVLILIGIFILLGGYSMDTTVSSYGDEYHNIGLMHERNTTIQLGGIALITGTVICCLNKKQTIDK